jgi:hypothetical protein
VKLVVLHGGFLTIFSVVMRSWLLVRFQVVTAVSIKMTVFWDVAPCSLAEVYQCFRGVCCCAIIALMLEISGTSETSVNFYQTTWCNTPEDSHPHGYCFPGCSYLSYAPAMCAPCDLPLSVQHILADGSAYAVRCERFCLPYSISDMLGDDPCILT